MWDKDVQSAPDSLLRYMLTRDASSLPVTERPSSIMLRLTLLLLPRILLLLLPLRPSGSNMDWTDQKGWKDVCRNLSIKDLKSIPKVKKLRATSPPLGSSMFPLQNQLILNLALPWNRIMTNRYRESGRNGNSSRDAERSLKRLEKNLDEKMIKYISRSDE